MDYSAVGETTRLAACMEQLATPTLRLVEGMVQVTALGLVPVKGLHEPVEVFELIGASRVRRRLQAAAVKGLSTASGPSKSKRIASKSGSIGRLHAPYHRWVVY